jgi:hypothetical protein
MVHMVHRTLHVEHHPSGWPAAGIRHTLMQCWADCLQRRQAVGLEPQASSLGSHSRSAFHNLSSRTVMRELGLVQGMSARLPCRPYLACEVGHVQLDRVGES